MSVVSHPPISGVTVSERTGGTWFIDDCVDFVKDWLRLALSFLACEAL